MRELRALRQQQKAFDTFDNYRAEQRQKSDAEVTTQLGLGLAGTEVTSQYVGEEFYCVFCEANVENFKSPSLQINRNGTPEQQYSPQEPRMVTMTAGMSSDVALALHHLILDAEGALRRRDGPSSARLSVLTSTGRSSSPDNNPSVAPSVSSISPNAKLLIEKGVQLWKCDYCDKVFPGYVIVAL